MRGGFRRPAPVPERHVVAHDTVADSYVRGDTLRLGFRHTEVDVDGRGDTLEQGGEADDGEDGDLLCIRVHGVRRGGGIGRELRDRQVVLPCGVLRGVFFHREQHFEAERVFAGLEGACGGGYRQGGTDRQGRDRGDNK